MKGRKDKIQGRQLPKRRGQRTKMRKGKGYHTRGMRTEKVTWERVKNSMERNQERRRQN